MFFDYETNTGFLTTNGREKARIEEMFLREFCESARMEYRVVITGFVDGIET